MYALWLKFNQILSLIIRIIQKISRSFEICYQIACYKCRNRTHFVLLVRWTYKITFWQLNYVIKSTDVTAKVLFLLVPVSWVLVVIALVLCVGFGNISLIFHSSCCFKLSLSCLYTAILLEFLFPLGSENLFIFFSRPLYLFLIFFNLLFLV